MIATAAKLSTMSTTVQPSEPDTVVHLAERLKQCLSHGHVLDLNGGAISAELIRAVLLQKPVINGEPVIRDSGADPRGLHLRNAMIAGVLDLENAIISRAVAFTSCRIPALNLVCANFQEGLDLAGSKLATINLSGAEISGDLNLRDVVLSGRDARGNSFEGTRVRVHGDVILDGAFSAAGGIKLLGGWVGGQLILRGTRLNGKNDKLCSFDGDDLEVQRSAFFDGDFRAAGCVRLLGAHIKGTLEMTRACLAGADDSGVSLLANRLRVDSDIFLDGGFTAAGVVSLRGMRADGRAIINANGIAQLAGRSVTAEPAVGLVLDGSSIGDLQVDFTGHDALNGRRARPDPKGALAMRRRRVSLDNCLYRAYRAYRSEGGNSEHVESPPVLLNVWLSLLRFHTPRYQPQAYQQLAAVHRVAGYDREAGVILMAQQDHRRATALRPPAGARKRIRMSLWLSRLGLLVWKITLGYGYRSRRALGWLMIVLAISTALVTVAANIPAKPGAGTPDDSLPVAYRPANSADDSAGSCTIGEAAGLVVRITIPLITNIGQGACVIDTTSGLGSLIILVSIVLQSFAWILGGLTVAAAASAIRRSG